MLIVVRDRDPGDEDDEFARSARVAQQMRRFRDLGYELGQALELAHHDIDPRYVAGLVDRGCSLALAARIVL